MSRRCLCWSVASTLGRDGTIVLRGCDGVLRDGKTRENRWTLREAPSNPCFACFQPACHLNEPLLFLRIRKARKGESVGSGDSRGR